MCMSKSLEKVVLKTSKRKNMQLYRQYSHYSLLLYTQKDLEQNIMLPHQNDETF